MAHEQPNFPPDFLYAFEHYREMRDAEAMRYLLNAQFQDDLTEPQRRSQRIAFAFDIDGVLVRSRVGLPGAKETLKFLQQNKISFIFLTNRGGLIEKDHVALLGQWLSVPHLSEHQFIQSHSPFRDLVPSLAEKNILVLGGVGNAIREVAHSYGFRHVLTPSDICKAYPHVYPFLELTAAHHAFHGLEIIDHSPEGQVKISAILVFSSPRDWGLDLQVVMDLLLSEKGYLGTLSLLNGDERLPNRGYLQDEQPPIHFSNPDLTWATAFQHPRVSQGSFRAALEGIWASRTGGAMLMNCKVVGKPTEETYVYGENALMGWDRVVNGEEGEIRTVYMVGDNPESDIQGANRFRSRYGAKWKSILVESGVHVADNEPAHKPHAVVKGVQEAVEWALKDSGLGNIGGSSDKGEDPAFQS
jgi:HAD superfamily hydrolase (TIGR01456 family)